jgi:hypothetical protein
MTSFRAEFGQWATFDGKPPEAREWAVLPHRSGDWMLDALNKAALDDENRARRHALYEKRAVKWDAKAVEEKQREEWRNPPSIPRDKKTGQFVTTSPEPEAKRSLICAFYHDPPCYLEHGGFLIKGTWVCFNHLADAYALNFAYDLVRE